MRNFLLKNGKRIAVIFTIIFSLILLSSAIVMLGQYRSEISQISSSKAQYYTLVSRNTVEKEINKKITTAVVVADAYSALTTPNEVYEYTGYLLEREGYKDIFDIRYYKNHILYSYNGDTYTADDISREYESTNPTDAKYVGTFDETHGEGVMSVLAFYAPVDDSSIMDAVVVYYTRNVINSFFNSFEKNEYVDDALLTTTAGKIVSGGESFENSDLLYSLKQKIGDTAKLNELKQILEQKVDGTVYTSIGYEDYVISVGASKDILHDLAVVELYKVDVLCSSSFAFVQTIISIIILFAVIVIFVLIYLLIRDANMKKRLFNMEESDTKLNCFNRLGFEKEAKKILQRNPESYFAVIVMHLRHYKYIAETYGDTEIGNLLQYIKLVCNKTEQIEETFGHIEDGDFALLLHAKDRHDLVDKLKIKTFILSQYKGANKFNILFKYGIYEIDRQENITVSNMLTYANEANNTVIHVDIQNADQQFNFYNNELRKIRLINEDMELRMEDALVNGEFQVFYQPKYNLNKNVQDGAEALVRWYDPKTKEYNKPALFMQLFETNGFITKLDRYVYTKVCEYISYSIAHGRKVYPISVNISRITAVQKDFIDYYSSIKRKYNIPDGYLMIEFTESFAYENYEILGEIVNKLHKNGFKCSIDDFGCGYSSYRILKELPMDEIKLDKFFLEKSGSQKRDDSIFESIITLGKKLGMKVTQEGIEEKEELERIRALGCDVIQGYYYSRPIPLTDYLNFVENSKDHKI